MLEAHCFHSKVVEYCDDGAVELRVQFISTFNNFEKGSNRLESCLVGRFSVNIAETTTKDVFGSFVERADSFLADALFRRAPHQSCDVVSKLASVLFHSLESARES